MKQALVKIYKIKKFIKAFGITTSNIHNIESTIDIIWKAIWDSLNQVLYNSLFSLWSPHVASWTCTLRPIGPPGSGSMLKLHPGCFPMISYDHPIVNLAFIIYPTLETFP